ncbi:hypothetical protein [Roseicyclus elongatus]|uniref:hypothetical protein n=1 Tax=Roseicyclus elongatus TaxID=159346 RepID=UPI00046CA038|nr:hypothetical protein [Roseibacterium elongatum]
MRRPVALIALCAVLLSACVGTREPEIPPLTLDGQGIEPTVSGLRIDFGRAQVGVIETVSRLLDERPAQVVTQTECGAGPITAASWEDGLTLNFVEGSFLGWTSSDPDLPVAGGFRPGQLRVQMPQVSFQVTTLGDEFSRGGVAGLLDPTGEQIALLWSGVTCFFR